MAQPSEVLIALARDCDDLDLDLFDGPEWGLFVPADPDLEDDLMDIALALAAATAQVARAHGLVGTADFPDVSVFSQPAWADDEPGLLVRMMSMVADGEDEAWDAAARLDLPAALSALAADLDRDGVPAVDIVDTARYVCSILQVIAGLARTAALTPRDR